MVESHDRLELIGLHYKTNGRVCEAHDDGCGLHLKKGDIIKLHKEEIEFQETVLAGSKMEKILNDKEGLRYEIGGRLQSKRKNWMAAALLGSSVDTG